MRQYNENYCDACHNGTSHDETSHNVISHNVTSHNRTSHNRTFHNGTSHNETSHNGPSQNREFFQNLKFQYRSRPAEDVEDPEEIPEKAEDVEKGQHTSSCFSSCVFFMLIFIVVFTGAYYVYGKIKQKFFLQKESEIKEYFSKIKEKFSKMWRDWDTKGFEVKDTILMEFLTPSRIGFFY